eukprot:3373505-Prymnesium_polylepis.1
MSEMNRAFVAPNAEVKGWRWVEQLVFTMYFSFATLAVLNIGLVLQWNDYLQTTHALNGGLRAARGVRGARGGAPRAPHTAPTLAHTTQCFSSPCRAAIRAAPLCRAQASC